VQSAEYSDLASSYSNSQTPIGIEGSAGLGYNGDHFLTGISASFDNTGYYTKTINIIAGTFAFRLFAGTRF
jgi:hypothetical protein